MPDEIDAALARAVAAAVETAPAPPTVDDIAVVVPSAPERRGRPVLAVAAVLALLVAGAVVLTLHHDATVSVAASPGARLRAAGVAA